MKTHEIIAKIVNDLHLEDKERNGTSYKGFTCSNDDVFNYLFNLDGTRWLYRYADYHYGFSIGTLHIINIIEGDIIISMDGLKEEVLYIYDKEGYAPFTAHGEALVEDFTKTSKNPNQKELF